MIFVEFFYLINVRLLSLRVKCVQVTARFRVLLLSRKGIFLLTLDRLFQSIDVTVQSIEAVLVSCCCFCDVLVNELHLVVKSEPGRLRLIVHFLVLFVVVLDVI